ncbi:retrovirus-related pol polyprotein from transposon TNT 1-94 [Tanacetum coccineum]
MEFESAQSNTTAKLPILKLGEYEMWVIRIKQYFQVQDYALWEVIENGNSWVSVPQTAQENGTSVTKMSVPVTAEEKTNKKNDVKARSLLLMALPNEHQLTFSQYSDAKTMFAAIETRFGGNEATKKTQKTLQLAILGENISQEDLNLKFLRSLPSEWNTHVVVWRNKPDLETMSFDDLYNNFKIVEQEVKRTGTSSSNSSSQNMAFVSTPGSTNEANTVNVQVSTANSLVSTDSTLDSTANLSDATVYAFLANQPNGSQLVHEDLEQIHEDDLEEMDLKWQLALLSMRARKYYQRTGKKITINGSDTAGYDKSKVECFNYHKMGHFARECRGTGNQEIRPRNQDNSRRIVNVEDTSSKAMVAINGASFDWSFMAEEEVTTNMALLAFLDSEVYNDKTCSNTCLKSFETLKTQLDNLRVEFNKSEFNLVTYKRGLASVEEQLVFYKKNEVMFCDQIAVLKRDASFKDSEINALKIEIEKLKNEKESNQIKINKFENASKCLDKLIGSQISDNSRKYVGYNDVPPPPTSLFAPPTIDLSNSDTSSEVKKTPGTPLVEELVSEKGKQTLFPTKIEFVKQQDKTARKPVKYAEMYRSQKHRGNQRNWNNLKSQQLGHDRQHFRTIVRFQEFDGYMIPLVEESRRKITEKMCDRKNCVLFTNTTCFVLSLDFKLPNESQILLKIPRKNNMYIVDMKNSVPKESLTCLVAKTLFMLHMDLFGPTFVSSLMNKKYCPVVTADYSRFTWVFFLASKDETSGILKNFITEIENLVDKKVKIIRCDNRTEFKNRVMNEFYEQKGIKREYSIARTPQQNGVAKRRNKTLIEAARTMLADAKLPTTFWAEAVNTACYVQNRVIIVKPHNKTPYELFRGRTPALSFMRPFGCHVFILNTLDHLGKFDGKSDDGFFVGYSLTSKAFRVYNIRTRRVEENLHIRFLEDKPIVSGNGQKWLFDIDSLIKSMNYVPVIAGTNSNDFAGSKVSIGEGTTSKETNTSQDYIVMPLWKDSSLFDSPSMNVSHDEPEPSYDAEKKDDEGVSKESRVDDQEKLESSTLNINTAGPSINTASANLKTGSLHINTVSPTVITTRLNRSQTVSGIYSLRDNVTSEATYADLFGDESKMDMSNLNASYQTRGMTKTANEQGFLSAVYEGKTHEDLHTLDLPKRKRVIGTKWIFKNKKVERGIVIRNKAKLVGQGYTQEEGIAYKGVFAPEVYGCQPPRFEDPDYPNKVYKVVKALYGLHQALRAWYETLAKYLLDNRFHRGKIDQTLFIKRQKGDILLVHVYVDDIIFGSIKKELCLEFENLMHDKFQMSSMRELTFFLGLQVKQKEDGIFISQDKYVTDILKKFGFQDVRIASTPMDTEKPLLNDSDGDNVDVHLYRSMIGSLMYLTSSMPNIMFACKKQTVVATSSTEAEYVATASFYGQNPVSHTKTKHIEIRYHFIRDCNDKKLIQVVKIHTDNNFADLLTKALDVGRHVKRGRDTKIPQSSGPPVKVGDEAVHKELGDRMERAATTASSLEAEQDSCNINRTQSMATLNEPIDFLHTSHIKFALTKNPTIYTSLIQQFWQTASTNTLEDGEVVISATIDGQLKTITEVSLGRHLKLEDANGISSLPNTDIFEQLALISPKKSAWEQFCSNIATAIIFLATNRTFNFSKMIFEGMRLLLPHKRSYVAPTLTQKLFNNMRRVSKGYTGVNIPLFSSMLVQGPIQQGKGSTVPVESHHTPITTPSTSQPPLSSPSKVPIPLHDSPLPGGHTPGSDKGSMTLNELMVLCTQLSTKVASLEHELKQTKKVYGNAYTKLIMRVKKLEHRVKTDTEEDTASATPEVSTAAANLVYIRRSAEKRKDKGKAIMKEDESVQKKAKKQLEQEILGHEEAVRLQEHINEEEKQRIDRDAKIAKQLQEEFNRARQEQKVIAKADQAHDIDWSDPAVLRYHALQNRSFSVAEVRKNMCMYFEKSKRIQPESFQGNEL